jgi:hypothetical protein
MNIEDKEESDFIVPVRVNDIKTKEALSNLDEIMK